MHKKQCLKKDQCRQTKKGMIGLGELGGNPGGLARKKVVFSGGENPRYFRDKNENKKENLTGTKGGGGGCES